MNDKKELFLKINGGQTTEILSAAVEVGLIESLKEKVPYKNLPGARLIGALHLLKIVTVDEEKATLTEQGRYLLSDHPETLLPLLRFKAAPFIRAAWGHLGSALKTGRSPFESAHGMPLFDYLAKNQEALKLFHEAMRFFAKESSETLLDAVDLSSYSSAVDLGGSIGAFCEQLKRRAPHLSLTLFDRPEVIALAGELPGIKKCAGDFFEAVPKADLTILRNILHDWSDASARKILRNLSGHVAVIETCRADSPAKSLGQISDLGLFVTTGEGGERTEEEWLSLFQSEDLKLIKIHKTSSAKSLFLLEVDQEPLKR